MRLIALHGRAGAGKDTFADRLVARHGFTKRGFADPLYEEVAAAFDVGVQWLRDRARKEVDQDLLRLARCRDKNFQAWAAHQDHSLMEMRSPRWVLQHWGTNYRRAQDERYWLRQMEDFIDADFGRRGLVIPDCRFPNEAEIVRMLGGRVIEIKRQVNEVHSHVSELRLPAHLVNFTVHNYGDVSYLHTVADNVMRGVGRNAAA